MSANPAEILAGAAKKLLELRRPEVARKVAELAVMEDSSCANGHSVLAVALDEMAEWRQGLAHARRAAELVPDSPQLRYNLALSTLRLNEYRSGFALMEARVDKPDWTGLAIAPSRAAERHRLLRRGDPVAGLRIFVISEQGLGDCIMFARFLPLLARKGARIAVACSPSLRPIFGRIAGIETLLSPPPDQPLAKLNLSQAEFDAWVPLLSLPVTSGPSMPPCRMKSPISRSSPPAWRPGANATPRRANQAYPRWASSSTRTRPALRSPTGR